VTADVSVIVPTLGESIHLLHAVESALACAETLEVLLVADAGRVDPARYDDPRVRHVERPAGGVSVARNAGIEAATGAYFAFLDDDDVWRPDHLARIHALHARHPEAVLLATNALVFDDPTEDGSMTPPSAGSPASRPHRDKLPSGPLRFETLLKDNPITTPAVVLVAGRLRPDDRFDPTLTHMEDYELWLRLARDRVLAVDSRPTVLVRKRRGSASRDLRQMAASSIRVLGRWTADRGGPVDPSELRQRLGRLWHELAYACLLEDDLAAARHALRESRVRAPGIVKNHAYWIISWLPSVLRHALLDRGHHPGGAATTPSAASTRRDG
jgi:glycosyltransferase involved in cell wall biosynthesis